METDSALAALTALAQESRLAIFRHLVEIGTVGSIVGPIADALELAPATLSFHLKELTRARLLVQTQEGRFIRYAANFETMNGLIAYLTDNCCGGNPERCAPACAPKTSRTTHKRTTS
ncbi:MAG TPA: helix-turn-helix domain-containing protein [Rudaea sp.]|jgi:DNA-binding transcriptional ArsR family regulator|nr:helix-turn-helix domain-containing protein [Rudaea sp.]